MPDLGTLTTLKDLHRNGWQLKFTCNLCKRSGIPSWADIRKRFGNDLNYSIHDIDSTMIAWKFKPRCSYCGAKGKAKLSYVAPSTLDESS